jgi:hypothetical protein
LYFTVNESFLYASVYFVKNFDACRSNQCWLGSDGAIRLNTDS